MKVLSKGNDSIIKGSVGIGIRIGQLSIRVIWECSWCNCAFEIEPSDIKCRADIDIYVLTCPECDVVHEVKPSNHALFTLYFLSKLP